jgi:hypothetical protein
MTTGVWLMIAFVFMMIAFVALIIAYHDLFGRKK